MTDRKQRQRARGLVSRAVHRGLMPRAKCLSCWDCGNQAAEFDHHRGYSPDRAFDVVPVCRDCHNARKRTRVEMSHGPEHHSARIDDAVVRMVRDLRSIGFTSIELGAMYGISRHSIQDIIAKRSWVHVDSRRPATIDVRPDYDRPIGPLAKRDYDRGSAHVNAKLTEEAVRSILDHAARGRTKAWLARTFRIGYSTVARLLKGEAWAHITARPV